MGLFRQEVQSAAAKFYAGASVTEWLSALYNNRVSEQAQAKIASQLNEAGMRYADDVSVLVADDCKSIYRQSSRTPKLPPGS